MAELFLSSSVMLFKSLNMLSASSLLVSKQESQILPPSLMGKKLLGKRS